MAKMSVPRVQTKMVAGVDGCRAGWVVAQHPYGQPDATTIHHVSSFAEILAIEPQPAAIAIDIPIGLPERTGPGGRDADIQARSVLGSRQSAVFTVPSRRAVMCSDYREACATALATSDPPRKVSKQAFNIFAKVREADRLMTPELQDRVFEVHPEVAFWALHGKKPLETPKKVKSRPNPPGLQQRRTLLSLAGYELSMLEAKHLPSHVAGPDDILDAIVCAWTAARILDGNAIRFPQVPSYDAKGLRMEIWG